MQTIVVPPRRRPALLSSLAAAGIAVLLLGAPLDALGAQEQAQQVFNPAALPDSAPTAKPARTVATLALAGDQKALESWLRANATAAYVGSERFAGDIATLIGSLKEGPRTILRLDDIGRGRVGVVLGMSPESEPERAIVVVLEPEAPHRVSALRLAQLTVSGS